MAFTTFTGSALFLSGVSQLNSSLIRITYSQIPRATNPAGATDALNAANYTLSGPNAVAVTSVGAAEDDSKSFDLALDSPLVTGTWTVTVANVETPSSVPLINPKSLSFDAVLLDSTVSISGGATNSSSEDSLRSYISPALKGKYWSALIAALGTADVYLRDLAINVFDQLFIVSSSEKYLDRLTSNNGLSRPSGVGITDDIYRDLAIKLSSNKITIQSFLEVLETFYGKDALRAHIDSEVGPFTLGEEDNLLIEVDNKLIAVIFHQNDFRSIYSATALEVASIINKYFKIFNTKATAVSYKDVALNANKVRIYSGALGLRGKIRILGGRAQNVLNFEEKLLTTQVIGTQWRVDIPPNLPGLIANRARLTFIGGTNPTLTLLHIGDYVNIYGDPFNANNRGTFQVIESTSTYFEIENIIAQQQATVTQIADDDILFFRPSLKTINNNPRVSFATNGDASQVDVFLAATTEAVHRTNTSGAYLKANDSINLSEDFLDSVSIARTGGNTVTVETTANHNLSTGMDVLLAPGQDDFMEGVKEVSAIVNPTTFRYVETGSNVTGTEEFKVFKNFKDAAGLVTLTTNTAHGLSNDQQFLIENLTVANDLYRPNYITNPVVDLTAWDPSMASAMMLDGKILTNGGYDAFPAATSFATSTVYDPDLDEWASISPMNEGRRDHELVTLDSGRVLAIGGNNAAGASITTSEVYDPDLDEWVYTTNMNGSRASFSAVKLNDGRVLAVGGGAAATAEIYNPITNIWTSTAAMNAVRFYFKAIKLNDGRVVAAGGVDAKTAGNRLDSIEIYNPSNDTWTLISPTFSDQRYGYAAIFIPEVGVSGKIFYFGGYDSADADYVTVETYDPAKNVIESAGSSTSGYLPALCRNWENKIVINGGYNAAALGPIATTTIFDPLNTSSTQLTLPTTEDRYGHQIFKLNNDKLITIGGAQALPTEIITQPTIAMASSGLNGHFSIQSANTKQFTYQLNDNSYKSLSGIKISDSNIIPFKAETSTNYQGPFIYDLTGSPAITETTTTITQNLVKSQVYSQLTVSNAANFPVNGGYLIFDFGYQNQLYPVKYTFKASNTLLLLDSTFEFPFDIPSGTSINVLKQKSGIWEPESPESVGTFYTTDSISGRIAASNLIDDIQAAGTKVTKTVLYPSDIGLGNAGYPVNGQPKLSDNVYIYGTEEEVKKNREE